MLKASIRKGFRDFNLNADFFAENGITGIIGPSGSGKSVSLQCIAGLQTPDSGEIMLDDQALYHSENGINIKTRDRRIGYVFQNYALFPHLTVKQNIAFGLKGKTNAEIKDKVADMIAKAHLTGYENYYPNQISGGQQQRVALARTLVTEPDLILLDEPFSALDHHVKHVLMQELLRIIKDNFSGVVLLVTHNMEEAFMLCDRVLLYNNGTIIQSGRKEEVFNKPKNVMAAKIMGCKNILPIKSIRISDNFIECMVNGIRLILTKRSYSKQYRHLGIYAENLTFVDKLQQAENVFEYRITDVVKGIYHTNLMIAVADTLSLSARIHNNQFASILEGKYRIKLPEDKLFLLE
jgi:molybdate transport system ATP-binding protein